MFFRRVSLIKGIELGSSSVRRCFLPFGKIRISQNLGLTVGPKIGFFRQNLGLSGLVWKLDTSQLYFSTFLNFFSQVFLNVCPQGFSH